jgi:hypothetical protein
MLWVCAPPSDQEENVYVFLPFICGVIALIVFVEPTITVRLKEAVALLPATAN